MVHFYTTDSNDKEKIMWLNIILSIILAYLTSLIITKMDWTSFWWLDIPSVFGYYGILNYFFDEYIWKWDKLRKIRFLNTPNLNGTWEGGVSSSYDNHTQKRNVLVTIKQSLTKMEICLNSDQSRGHSINATLLLDDVGSRALRYEYLNEPKNAAPETMHMHRGTSRLILIDDNTLDGDYYTGRDRVQRGLVILKRIEKKQI
jgi:hypothetical protein